MDDDIPSKHVSWGRACRLIPSRFPPVELYEPVADQKGREALKALETLTNPRLSPDGGVGDFLRPDDRHVMQPWLVAPFAYLDPEPTPYSDGSYGVCIVAETEKGALAAAVQRREAFMRATAMPPMRLDMRQLVTPVSATLHDLTNWPRVGDSAETRRICQKLREQGSYGVLLASPFRVRESTAVLFRPTAMARATQAKHYCFVWDGSRISGIYDYSDQTEQTFDPATLITLGAKAAA
ncbi:MAG: RES family NAD+ phosphorylase [Hyphomicrobiaceae bacterium]